MSDLTRREFLKLSGILAGVESLLFAPNIVDYFKTLINDYFSIPEAQASTSVPVVQTSAPQKSLQAIVSDTSSTSNNLSNLSAPSSLDISTQLPSWFKAVDWPGSIYTEKIYEMPLGGVEAIAYFYDTQANNKISIGSVRSNATGYFDISAIINSYLTQPGINKADIESKLLSKQYGIVLEEKLILGLFCNNKPIEYVSRIDDNYYVPVTKDVFYNGLRLREVNKAVLSFWSDSCQTWKYHDFNPTVNIIYDTQAWSLDDNYAACNCGPVGIFVNIPVEAPICVIQKKEKNHEKSGGVGGGGGWNPGGDTDPPGGW
jgi:hypothetical protein